MSARAHRHARNMRDTPWLRFQVLPPRADTPPAGVRPRQQCKLYAPLSWAWVCRRRLHGNHFRTPCISNKLIRVPTPPTASDATKGPAMLRFPVWRLRLLTLLSLALLLLPLVTAQEKQAADPAEAKLR